jgi:hypothetical protein
MSAPGNPNYNTILSTTLAHHIPKLVDNVFSARPFFYFLKQAGQIKMVGGGHKIVQPIMSGLNSTAGSYSGYDTIAVTAQTGITAAEFPWKQYAATIAISGIEEAQNRSEEEVVDLLEAKTAQAEHTIIEKLDQMLIAGDGTGNSNKDWDGIKKLVAGHPNNTTIGGINPTLDGTGNGNTDPDNRWWASFREATAEVLSIGRMSSAYNSVSEGADQPNVILTTQVLYEKYEALLQPQLRFADAGTADAGFQNLLFKGAPVMYDTYVDSGYVYFLNTKYLRLVGHSDNWFRPTPFVRPNNTDARYAQILLYGNLTVSNRKRQGVLTAKTAS